MDIDDWRRKIDAVDSEILRLLNLRAQFSIEIGHLKQKRNLPIHWPEREREIVERMMAENPGPMSNDGVRRVFERIIDESRKVEKGEMLKSESKRKEA